MPLVSFKQALSLLKSQEPVALPTETVYGLAAPISSPQAIQKIFSIKKRPFFDPLIVHVKDLEQAQTLAHWDALSQTLVKEFWPGPLTVILPKKNTVSKAITSGGDTVGLRCPSHPVMKDILSHINSALAAPSANYFGHTSPTQAHHVIQEFSNSLPVLDGGACIHGIESTVLQVHPEKNKIYILRPGIITQKDLEDFLTSSPSSPKTSQLKNTGDENLKPPEPQFQGKKVHLITKTQTHSPGHLKNHYQPHIPFILCPNPMGKIQPQDWVGLNIHPLPVQWHLKEPAHQAARELYQNLRDFSEKNQPIYLIIKEKWKKDPLWQALLDRLHKACHFYGYPKTSSTPLILKPKPTSQWIP